MHRKPSSSKGDILSTEFDLNTVLLVDPDDAFAQLLERVLGANYHFERASSVNEALVGLESSNASVILLNLDAFQGKGNEDALAILRAASEKLIPLPVIAFTWDVHRRKTMEILQAGVFDILDQPLDVQQLKFSLDRACRRVAMARELLQAQKILGVNRIEGLLGNSRAIEQVSDVTRKVAGVFTSVLVTGESGTGKGVVAQAIHRMSPRASKPFVAFSVCAFPDTLIEDELFGHEKGAFTGAAQVRRGRFEEANGGTIFLDEIGDLALPLQAKLLRVLQERTVERLGSNVSRPIDVRVICATSRNLEKMVEAGTFREDLYFRISVVKIQMPALRERVEDIPLLAEYFLRMFAKVHGKNGRALTPGFLSALARHSWPGNVRELQNVMERSVVLANGNETLGLQDLPESLRGLSVSEDLPAACGSFHDAVQAFKRELVRSALRMHSGNKLQAAKELGISRCYLHRLLNQFGMAGDQASRQEQDADDIDETSTESRPQESSLVAHVA